MDKERLSDEEFRNIFSKVPRLCIDIVINDSSGRILLTKRAIEPYFGEWHIPGGSVRFHETLEDAVKRIAKEELGIKIKPVKLLGFMEFLKEDKERRHSVSLVFQAEIIAGEITLDKQAADFGFFEDIPEKTVAEHKDFILKNLFSKI